MDDLTLEEREARLRRSLRAAAPLAVAYSGGVDSTLLAAVAHEELGDGLLAITAESAVNPRDEVSAARELAARLGIRHVVVRTRQMEDEAFLGNPPNRCYICKKQILAAVREQANGHGIRNLAEGSTVDDLSDHRPGMAAVREEGVSSPLLEAGLDKAAVRALSRRMGLPTAGLPSMACLASRIPFGERITAGKLKAVDEAETGLRALGLTQVRVRHHGELARIEALPAELESLCAGERRGEAARICHAAGFRFVCVDLDGYRTGSLNPVTEI